MARASFYVTVWSFYIVCAITGFFLGLAFDDPVWLVPAFIWGFNALLLSPFGVFQDIYERRNVERYRERH